MGNNTFNILLCIDDFKGDYTRHCAVTMISVLETNLKHKIKFYVMSSCLSEENIKELKKIVSNYNQEIEFILRDRIIPQEIMDTVINRRNLTWGTWYRLFFPLYIKNISRILYMDCDVIVNKDLNDIYNMDMKGKTIAGYYDTDVTRYISEKNFETKNYINAGVILIDVVRFKEYNINKELVSCINSKYGDYINNSDQDYLNIIFKDDIYVYGQEMNYLVEKPFCNKGIDGASIYHCLAKPYVENSLSPSKISKLYFSYLNKTKRSGYKLQKRIFYFGFVYDYFYQLLLLLFKYTIGVKYFFVVDRYLGRFYNFCLSILKVNK